MGNYVICGMKKKFIMSDIYLHSCSEKTLGVKQYAISSYLVKAEKEE
jgi:hypothetical protein